MVPLSRLFPLSRRERAGVRGGLFPLSPRERVGVRGKARRPSVRHPRALLPLLLLATLAATACLTFHRPEVTFRGVAVSSIRSDGVNLQADLDVFNPNSYKIGVEKLSYRLRVNGNDAGSGEVEQPTSLPGKTTTTVHLPLRLDWTKIKSAGLDFLTRGVDYAVEGEITFSTPIGVFHRPYRHAGTYSPLGER